VNWPSVTGALGVTVSEVHWKEALIYMSNHTDQHHCMFANHTPTLNAALLVMISVWIKSPALTYMHVQLRK